MTPTRGLIGGVLTGALLWVGLGVTILGMLGLEAAP